MTRAEFTRLVNATQESLRRFLLALCCGDSMQADDLAQDTYLKAYLALDSIRSEALFRSWLFKIAYHTFVSSGRSTRHTVSYDEVTSAATEAEPFEHQALYQAISSLTDKERSALLLFYMEGYNVKEIADMMGAKTDAVKQWLSRGRTHLKEKLQ